MKNCLALLFILLCTGPSFGQTQKALERKKAAIQAKINQYDALLKEVREEESTMGLRIATTDKKIRSTQEIIKITNQEANALTRKITTNEQRITLLTKEIKALKEEYAAMIVKAYKRKNEQSRLMFLLSSESFLQAYKRIQYLKSYADYRKQQAINITKKKEEVERKTAELATAKKNKLELLAKNKKQRDLLQKDKAAQEKLIAQVKANKSKYSKQFKKAAKERDQIDKEIKRLIAARIKASYKGSGKKVNKSKFYLSPEAKKLASTFTSNRGKLPWPVDKGFVSRTYGELPSPINPTLRIYSSGWRFQVPKGTKARAIFAGTVDAIAKKSNGILIVYIRHGNYTSVYNNLKSVSVAKGDKVKLYDNIGEIYTTRAGVSELRFILMEDTHTLDPAKWLLRK